MGLILQVTLDTTSMVTLLASMCVVLFGAIGFLYVSKEKAIKEVRDEHLKDLREKNELSSIEHQLMQTMVTDMKEIKNYINK